MRMSRKSVLKSSIGVKWEKWNAISNVYSYYTQGAWETNEAGARSGTVSGYTGYSFNSTNGQYSNTGTYISIPLGSSGTLYGASGQMVQQIVVGAYTVGTNMSFAQGPYYYSSYTKGSTFYGYVFSQIDVRPDYNIGYIYVTSISQSGSTYIIMRNGSTYYAYKQI